MKGDEQHVLNEERKGKHKKKKSNIVAGNTFIVLSSCLRVKIIYPLQLQTHKHITGIVHINRNTDANACVYKFEGENEEERSN